MGASLSNLTEPPVGTSSGLRRRPPPGPGLGDIPENCVASVFLHLTPPEICNLARLNRAFRGASSSDPVWESKLPPNYHHMLALLFPSNQDSPSPHNSTSTSNGSNHNHLCKKDIFALLCRPIPFDDGAKEVWLNKVTAGVCMSISAKAMSITGIDDRRYWTWIPTEESRFHVVAFLQQIWWFEVYGSVKFPFPAGVYSLSFRLHLGKFSRRLGRRLCNYEHTHGWDLKPVRFELSTSDGQQASSECLLDEPEKDNRRGIWIEYRVGEFIVGDTDSELEIRYSMKQIDCTHSKGGLCVDSVSIVPSDSRKEARYRWHAIC